MASTVLGMLMVLFLVVPLVGSLASSATSLPTVLTDRRTLDAISLSFYAALLATVLSFVLGVPLAYLLTRSSFPGRGLLDSLIDLPIIIPHNAAGIALLTVLSPSSPIGALLEAWGVRTVDSVTGIVIAMAFVSAPFMIRSAQEAFESVSPRLERMARSLGATEVKMYVSVTLPLASHGILTGCLLTWARAVSEFGAVAMLAYYPKTAAVLLYDVFTGEGLRAALPINGLLLLLAVVLLFVFRSVTAKPTKLVR